MYENDGLVPCEPLECLLDYKKMFSLSFTHSLGFLWKIKRRETKKKHIMVNLLYPFFFCICYVCRIFNMDGPVNAERDFQFVMLHIRSSSELIQRNEVTTKRMRSLFLFRYDVNFFLFFFTHSLLACLTETLSIVFIHIYRNT